MKTRFGICPMIVGCVATADPLRRYARRPPASCDMLEVRLDLIGADNGSWKERCAAIRDKGMPVLLTVRSAQEGGEWRGREAERLALYLAGMPYVSAIDLEINTRAFEKVAQTARCLGESASSWSRKASGSIFTRSANSSMKDSVKKALCECPTLRQYPTGTPLRVASCRMRW